eukprot:256573_1
MSVFVYITIWMIFIYKSEGQSYNNVYTTDCGGQSGCGTVNGCAWSNSGVAPSEGLYGVSCSCPGGALTEVCTYNGKKIYKCANNALPSCKAPCEKEICLITSNNKQATGKIVSACPKYHPQNADQCCKHKNDAYCTCIIRNTVDCASAVYSGIGGSNTFVNVHSGACSSLNLTHSYQNTTV